MPQAVHHPLLAGTDARSLPVPTEFDRLADLAISASRQLKRLAYAGKLAQTPHLPQWQELQDLALSVKSQLALDKRSKA